MMISTLVSQPIVVPGMRSISTHRWKQILFIVVFVSICFLVFHSIRIAHLAQLANHGIGQAQYRKEPNSPLKEQKIPKIIHQIWKDNDLSTYSIKASREEWIKRYPDFEVRLWTENEIRDLIKEKYEWLWNLYMGYSYNIQRADVARYVVLYDQGGIYADLDCFPKDDLGPILDAEVGLVSTLDGKGVSNHFMLAEKNSPFLLKVLSNLQNHDIFILIPYLRVFYSTGPLFLTIQLADYSKPMDLLLTQQVGNKYNIHKAGRSWHGIDGFIGNWVADNKEEFKVILYGLLCTAVLITLLIVYVQRRRRRRYKRINV